MTTYYKIAKMYLHFDYYPTNKNNTTEYSEIQYSVRDLPTQNHALGFNEQFQGINMIINKIFLVIIQKFDIIIQYHQNY